MSVAWDHPGASAKSAAVPSNFHRGGRFNWHQRRRHALVQRLMKGLKGRRVLDYGCGYGDLTYAISKTNPVVGIDVDPTRVAFAQSHYPELDFQAFDGGIAPFADGSFDVVLSCVVLPFVTDHGAHLADIRRVLVKRGVLILISRNESVVSNIVRSAFGLGPQTARLNVISPRAGRRLLVEQGFRIEREDYFFDPPLINWRGLKQVAIGICEQMLSLFRVRSAASYFAIRAHADDAR